MSPEALRELLRRVQGGDVAVDEALERLRALPFRDVGIATIDHHRALRQGTPEVVFGEGKSPEQLVTICDEILSAGHDLFVTRLSADKVEVLRERHPELVHNAAARTVRFQQTKESWRPAAPVAVVSAGTSDIPVAEEAVETLTAV
ncbi:MAG: 1-(5-phosphoribosyl)-5-amino-4-imidazole-carboxylate carboxylase, partial [Myxococcales bacterium]|nr:1-(5-phosphoribosyl)-5-amino-4-imidazole-carboxylate carboxylase [Myxococcales bacterium]